MDSVKILVTKLNIMLEKYESSQNIFEEKFIHICGTSFLSAYFRRFW